MPRTGITEAQILAAIEALEARGEPITKITVRKELGDTGSYGTISAFLQRWREGQAQLLQDPTVAIPEQVQGLFAKAWSVAQAAAQSELGPERESMAQEKAALNAAMAQAQAENDEAVRVLEVQLEAHAAQLAEAVAKDQGAQARLAELSENLGYLKAKLETAAAAEAAACDLVRERETRIGDLEGRLRELQGQLAKADLALKQRPGKS